MLLAAARGAVLIAKSSQSRRCALLVDACGAMLIAKSSQSGSRACRSVTSVVFVRFRISCTRCPMGRRIAGYLGAGGGTHSSSAWRFSFQTCLKVLSSPPVLECVALVSRSRPARVQLRVVFLTCRSVVPVYSFPWSAAADFSLRIWVTIRAALVLALCRAKLFASFVLARMRSSGSSRLGSLMGRPTRARAYWYSAIAVVALAAVAEYFWYWSACNTWR